MLAEEMLTPASQQFQTRHYEAETDLESPVGRASGEQWNLWLWILINGSDSAICRVYSARIGIGATSRSGSRANGVRD